MKRIVSFFILLSVSVALFSQTYVSSKLQDIATQIMENDTTDMELLLAIENEAITHHIALTEDAVIAKGTLAKVNPPIRTEKDRLAIIEGLKDGTIDIIATDHAPHAKEEKDKPLTEAPSGMLGLEAALPLCIEKLVKEAGMSMMEVLDKLTAKPAAMYNIDRGDLRVDGPADIVIFNPDEKWTVTGFQSKSQNSPFLGEELTGKVKYTICKGKVVYKD